MPQVHKGDRDAMTVRPAAPVGVEVRRRAKEHGLSVSDYVSTLLAQHVGQPELAPVARLRKHEQEEALPLTG